MLDFLLLDNKEESLLDFLLLLDKDGSAADAGDDAFDEDLEASSNDACDPIDISNTSFGDLEAASSSCSDTWDPIDISNNDALSLSEKEQ